MWGATAVKARYAITNLARGMTRSFLSAERRFRVLTYSVGSFLRCCGSPDYRIFCEHAPRSRRFGGLEAGEISLG